MHPLTLPLHHPILCPGGKKPAKCCGEVKFTSKDLREYRFCLSHSPTYLQGAQLLYTFIKFIIFFRQVFDAACSVLIKSTINIILLQFFRRYYGFMLTYMNLIICQTIPILQNRFCFAVFDIIVLV